MYYILYINFRRPPPLLMHIPIISRMTFSIYFRNGGMGWFGDVMCILKSRAW